jgi:hypothetical protein
MENIIFEWMNKYSIKYWNKYNDPRTDEVFTELIGNIHKLVELLTTNK